MREPHHVRRVERSELAAAVARERPVGRSHRLHRPRGGFCGRGYCQQCPLADGELACETPEGTGRPRGLDIRRPFGFAGQRMEPWFYESRFLRPSFARQWSLSVLRRLSSADHLPAPPAARGQPLREITTDVLVIGGGPAGAAASAAAGSSGARTIAITRSRFGGSLPLDSAAGARLEDDLASAYASGVEVLENTVCLGRYEQEDRFVAMDASGPIVIHAGRCVIATGAYDRPMLLTGADLPGVVGLRAFQLLASQGAFRNGRLGVLGGAVERHRAAATAEAFGLRVAWSIGADDPPVGRIRGRRHARGIELTDGHRLAADVVVVGLTQPTYELQTHLGATPRFEGSPPVIRAELPTETDAIVVGEAAGWSDAPGTGKRAATTVREWLAGGAPRTEEPWACDAPTIAGSPEDVVCVCEDVRRRDLDRAIDDGFADVDLVKRRSGASTGACQGKLCLSLIAEAFTARGLTPTLPTVRPPIRPVRVGRLGATK